jgi:hypothetical protein
MKKTLEIDFEKFQRGIFSAIDILGDAISTETVMPEKSAFKSIGNKVFYITKCIDFCQSLEIEYKRVLDDTSYSEEDRKIYLKILKLASEFKFKKARKILVEYDFNRMVFGPTPKFFLHNDIDDFINFFCENEKKNFYFHERD